MRGCALWKVVRNLVHKKLKNRGAKFRATPTLVGHAPMLKHYPLGLGLCLSLEWMQPYLFKPTSSLSSILSAWARTSTTSSMSL